MSVGRHCFEDILRHVDATGNRLCVGRCPLSQTMRDGVPRETCVWLHHKHGHRVEVRVGVRPVRERSGQIIGAIETFTDESDRAATKARLAELEHLAMIDPLTGVSNRRFLGMTLSSRLAELRRYAVPFVVAFADIDHFKRVNDENGHDIGDDVLRMVANTLAGNLRGSDSLSRFGGEEFVPAPQSHAGDGCDPGVRTTQPAGRHELRSTPTTVASPSPSLLAPQSPDLAIHASQS